MAKMASSTLRASTRWSRRQKVGCVGTGYLPWRLRRIPRARRCAWLKPRANLAISFCPRGAPQSVAKTTPAVGLAKLAPAAGRINRTAELGDIDEGFDHQHRMAVSALPIGG